MNRPVQAPDTRFDVVALVASAGGEVAILSILQRLPAGFPVALVLMQHLAPQSAIVELYGRRSPFETEWIRSGSALAPGRLQVCPPRSFVDVMPDGTCVVSPCEGGAIERPIDRFLESLARSFGPRAIAVVLSGMGTDGADGARQLRLMGGCVLVQSEATAEHSSMPRAAMRSGAADVVLPVDEIAAVLIDLASGGPVPRPPSELEAVEALFAGDGLARADMRAMNWAETPLGPVLQWAQPLRTTVRNAMASSFPTCICWGPELVQIYNDAYLPLLGAKPSPAGRPARLTWAELWSTMGPQLVSVLDTGNTVFSEDRLFQPNRRDHREEWYLTSSYSPLHDTDGSVAGVLCTFTDTTARVRAARRLETLLELAAIEGGESAFAVLEAAARVLMDAPFDVPFALFYLLDGPRQRANLSAAVGLPAGSAAAPHTFSLVDEPTAWPFVEEPAPWPLAEVARTGVPLTVDALPLRKSDVQVGPWPEPPRLATLLPLQSGAAGSLLGVLVLGQSPRLRHDPMYADFLGAVARHVSKSLGEAEVRRLQRDRADRQADLDRTKIEFFSNVSHEFRTPLTLLLAPIEELQRRRESLPVDVEAEIDAAARNGRRLLSLVNNLLDFSQGESRHGEGSFEPTELQSLTTDIASAFGAAIEAAGLRLRVDCPPELPPVWIDRDMWERIVSNLLSNALKFTFEGEIGVELRPLSLHAELVVRDTGIGIPEHELPHLFKRFHRVRGARARTQVGSGIGLWMVNDLVKRLGGQLLVRSTEGVGTTFTVWVPYKSPRALAEAGRRAGATPGAPRLAEELAQEASQWLRSPDGTNETPEGVMEGVLGPPRSEASGQRSPKPARILVVDDDADMRDYLRRLLKPQWEVSTAADGVEALEAARRERPDVILTDVMMPGLDGFHLLERVRADADLQHMAMILLTARAGEEAAIQGLLAGAHDYIAKPFSPRELVARVQAVVDRARAEEALRKSEAALRESEARLRAFVTASVDVVYRMNADWTQMEQLYSRGFLSDTPEPTDAWLDQYIPPDEQPRVIQAIDEAVRSGHVFELEHRVRRADGSIGWTLSRAVPIHGGGGEVVEWIGTASDITHRREVD